MTARHDSQAGLPPSGPGRLWAQIKIIGGIVVAIFMVLGAFQLWDLQLRSHPFVVEVEPEVDVRGFDNSAEWLFQRLHFDLVDPSTEEVILDLPAGSGLARRQDASVRGRQQRRLAQSNRLVGYFHHPALPKETFRFAARTAPIRGDTLSMVLTLSQTQSFLRREIETLISVRDDRDRLVTGLQTYRGIPLIERVHEPGVYDIEITVDDFIYQLEEHDKFTIDVAIEQEPDFRKQVEVPAAWFTGEGRERHVVTLAGSSGARSTSDSNLVATIVAPATAIDSGADAPRSAGDDRPQATTSSPGTPPAAAETPEGSVVSAPAAIAVVGAATLPPGTAQTPSPAGTTPTPGTAQTPSAGTSPASDTAQTPPPADPAGASAASIKGKVRIRVLPYADFYVGDERVAAQVGLAEAELDPGTYAIRVEHPFFKPHTWSEVVVGPGATVSLFHSFPTKATGKVTVGWRQGWAEVYVDGKTTTKTTPCELTLGVGPHVLVLVRDGAAVPGMRKDVHVIEDGEVHVQF